VPPGGENPHSVKGSTILWQYHKEAAFSTGKTIFSLGQGTGSETINWY
jgi:hypothetical protein